MTQQNLEGSILLKLDYDILKQIDVTDVSDEFVQRKVSKSFKND